MCGESTSENTSVYFGRFAHASHNAFLVVVLQLSLFDPVANAFSIFAGKPKEKGPLKFSYLE